MGKSEFEVFLLGCGFVERKLPFGEAIETHFIKSTIDCFGRRANFQFELYGTSVKFASSIIDEYGIIRVAQFIPCFSLDDIGKVFEETCGNDWCMLNVVDSCNNNQTVCFIK